MAYESGLIGADLGYFQMKLHSGPSRHYLVTFECARILESGIFTVRTRFNVFRLGPNESGLALALAK